MNTVVVVIVSILVAAAMFFIKHGNFDYAIVTLLLATLLSVMRGIALLNEVKEEIKKSRRFS